MDELSARLECLRLAHAGLSGHPTASVVDRARAYADFVTGRRDAEVLRAAHELANAVRSPSAG